MLDFNETIEYPEEMARKGFTFIGWIPRPETMPAENITVTAQWEITNATEYVEIVFSEKDLSEEEIRDIIKEFVPEGADFTIEKTENESGEILAIVKFTDAEVAKNFVENVVASSDAKKSIKNIGFGYDHANSFSPSLSLSTLVCSMLCLISF